MSIKTIVELDLVGYSDVSRTLEENADVEVVAKFNDQIQQFVDVGLAAINTLRTQVVLATTGDGAILALDQPLDAHNFATAVHDATRKHNVTRTVASAQRWFRIGAATGELYQRPRAGGGQEIAGTTIANAVRLEAAAQPGQLLMDIRTFASLPPATQALYGPEETVAGKRGERFAARRCTVVPFKASDDSPPTVQGILALFDRLNPRNQLDTLMLLIGMPTEHRPPDTLELFRRQGKILDWAVGSGAATMARLSAALKDLILKQQS